jgi:hypothetical protein
MVLASYKRNRVPLSFALSALLPVLNVTCPQLTVVAPLRGLTQLPGMPAAAGGSSSQQQQQQPPAAVELVLRLSKLHASVGYNTSCYSSLLQQVDATADAEAVFQQRFSSAAAHAAAHAQHQAPYAALWLHPDDLQRLQEQQQSEQQAHHGAKGSSGNLVRQSVRTSLFAGSSGGLGGVRASTVARCVCGNGRVSQPHGLLFGQAVLVPARHCCSTVQPRACLLPAATAALLQQVVIRCCCCAGAAAAHARDAALHPSGCPAARVEPAVDTHTHGACGDGRRAHSFGLQRCRAGAVAVALAGEAD